jgi:hypothetical protein
MTTTAAAKAVSYWSTHALVTPTTLTLRRSPFTRLLSFARVTLGFKTKPNAHSMCPQESSFHTYRTENGYKIKKFTIYSIYYTNNVFNKRLK